MSDSDSALERVVLVGFMGAGKSAVGRCLADRLGWRFIDTDAVVEERFRRPIADVFAELGEAAFREVEAEVTEVALSERRAVISTGGGWPEVEGRMETVPEGSLTIWLTAPLDVLLDRVAAEPGARPLLDRGDAAEKAGSLLERREPRYARAERRLDTTAGTPESIADIVVRWIRTGESQETSKAT